MKYDPDRHHRRSVRYCGSDYTAQGAYFLTMCASRRGEVFGRVEGETVQLNRFGRVVAAQWLKSLEVRREIALDEWIVMPDHLHAIVCLAVEQVEQPTTPKFGARPPRSISSLVAGYKSAVTREISELRGQPTIVWQRSYWDRIIRNEAEWENERRYIRTNSQRFHRP